MLFAAFIESSPVSGDACFRITLPADVVQHFCGSTGTHVKCTLNGDVFFMTSPAIIGDDEGYVSIPSSLCQAYGLRRGGLVYVELDPLSGKTARLSPQISAANP